MPVSEHRYRRRAEFAETDMAGMVHFSVYLRYVEEAEHAMWRAAGLNIADPASPYGFPRIAFSIEYHAPLRFQDEFEVHIQVTEVRERSLRYRATITRGREAIATSTHAAVCVRKGPDGLEAAVMPPEVAGAFTAAAPATPPPAPPQ
ncbi:MAG: thioesterase family protein [Vicinamibacterales bacterium]